MIRRFCYEELAIGHFVLSRLWLGALPCVGSVGWWWHEQCACCLFDVVLQAVQEVDDCRT